MPNLSSTECSPEGITRYQLELPRRCGIYWLFWQGLVKASMAMRDERYPSSGGRGGSEKNRLVVTERAEEYGRAIGVHLAECEQCRRWLESCKTIGIQKGKDYE